MKNILLICLYLCCSLPVFAQQMVEGKVTDNYGDELIGATVIQKGTSNGVITDIDGHFVIKLLPDAVQVVEVSMIGYKKVEIDTKKTPPPYNIVLSDDNVNLEEVVVVGYGTQKKASITGAISNVGNKELSSVPVASATNALTGRVPGLVTRQESGRPGGDDAKIFIRGRASFNQSDPLVLVDGVERSFAQVNPEDIESVSVLKDASATAVYGVRGANGVILVTTRRGTEREKARISFSAELGITQYNRIAQTLNAENVARFQREGTISAGMDPSVRDNTRNMLVSEYDIHLYRTQESPFTHPDNNFVDMFTKDGSTQKYNVNISGGSKKLKFFVSFSHLSQTGMFQTDINEIRKHPTIARLIEESPAVDAALVKPAYNPEYYFNRTTARSNLDIALNDDFTVSVDLSYIFRKQNRPGTYDGLGGDGAETLRLFGQFYRNAPMIFPIVNPNGSMGGNNGVWRQNPLVTMLYTGYRSDYKNSLESSVKFNYNLRKLLKGLSIDGRFSFDSNWNNWRGMQYRPGIYSYNPVDGSYNEGLAASAPVHEQFRDPARYKTYVEAALRYKTNFAKDHNISAMTSASMQSISAPVNAEYNYVPHIYQNLVGRVNYDYAGRYLVEINAGYNGSNRFSKGNRFAFFPSGSVGWVPTNEPFFPENKILSYMKLRGSVGKVGNDNLGSFSYYYVSSYGTEKINGDNGRNNNYGFGETPGNNLDGISALTLGNIVTWETATKYNVGLESSWFNSSLTFNVDIFKERREDILTDPKRFVLAAGVKGLPPYNFGIVENKGFDMEVGWASSIRDFNYHIKGIVGWNRNKIIERSEASKPYPYMYQAGLPINQNTGYTFDGFFSSYEEIASSPQQFGLTNIRPGDMKYKDINGDGVIDENDKGPIGYSPIPELSYSLNLGLAYKGFELNVMLQGAARYSVFLKGDVGWDNSWGNYYEEHINRWTPETAATASYPRFGQGANGELQNYYDSDFWLKDGKFLRLKNVMLSYTFNKKWLAKTPFNSVMVFVNGYNLATWDKLKKLDPEVPPGTNGQFYPQQKQYNAGVNVTF